MPIAAVSIAFSSRSLVEVILLSVSCCVICYWLPFSFFSYFGLFPAPSCG